MPVDVVGFGAVVDFSWRVDVGRPVFWSRLTGEPLGEGEEVALGVGGWAGGRVEAGLVGLTALHGAGHLVVDFEDDVLGVVSASCIIGCTTTDTHL